METLLRMSVSGGVLIAVIALIRLVAVDRLPKRLFTALWCLALLRLLTPLSVSLPTPLPVPSIPSPELHIAEPSEPSGVLTPSEGSQVTDAPVIGDVPAVKPTVNGTVTPSTNSADVPKGDLTGRVRLPVLPTVWAAVVLGIGLFIAVSRRRFLRELKMSLPVENEFARRWLRRHRLWRPVELRELTGLPSPLTYGTARPVILVPRGFDWSDRSGAEYVLYHEYTHIRRFHAALKLLMTAALCVHWFNPLVWLMYVLFDRDLELSCDEAVLRHFGSNRRRDYAETIIGMEERRALPVPFGSFFSKNTAEERIRAIMKFNKKSVMALVIALALASLGTLTVFAAGDSQAPAPPADGVGDNSEKTDPADPTQADKDDSADPAPAGSTYEFTYSGLKLRVSGVQSVSRGVSNDGGEEFPYDVYVLAPGATMTVLEADMFEDTDGVRHGDWALYTAEGEYIYIVDRMEPVELTPDILGVVDPESSLYVLGFRRPAEKLSYYWGGLSEDETAAASLYTGSGFCVYVPDTGWDVSYGTYAERDSVRWDSAADAASFEVVDMGPVSLADALRTVREIETGKGYSFTDSDNGVITGEMRDENGAVSSLRVSFYASRSSAFALIRRVSGDISDRTAAELQVFEDTFGGEDPGTGSTPAQNQDQAGSSGSTPDVRQLTYQWGSPANQETVDAALYTGDGFSLYVPEASWDLHYVIYGDYTAAQWLSSKVETENGFASLEVVDLGQMSRDQAQEAVSEIESGNGYALSPTGDGGLTGERTEDSGLLYTVEVSIYDSRYSTFALIQRRNGEAPQRVAAELRAVAGTFDCGWPTTLWVIDHTGELSDRDLIAYSVRSDGALAESLASELAHRFTDDPGRMLDVLASETEYSIDNAVYLLAEELAWEDSGALEEASRLDLTSGEREVLEQIREQYDLARQNI